MSSASSSPTPQANTRHRTARFRITVTIHTDSSIMAEEEVVLAAERLAHKVTLLGPARRSGEAWAVELAVVMPLSQQEEQSKRLPALLDELHLLDPKAKIIVLQD